MNCAAFLKADAFMQSNRKEINIMFMTKKEIIMRRIKRIATALAIVAMYAAMVGVAVLLINNF